MQPPTFENAVGATLALVAVLVVSFLAVTGSGDVRSTALGALIAIIAAATSFFLRARVQPPAQQPPAAPPKG